MRSKAPPKGWLLNKVRGSINPFLAAAAGLNIYKICKQAVTNPETP